MASLVSGFGVIAYLMIFFGNPTPNFVQYNPFAQAVMECWPMGDLDGSTLQDAAVAHGLLVPETRHEPCAEGCCCAENADAQEWSFGVVCYRKTPLLKGPNALAQGRAD